MRMSRQGKGSHQRANAKRNLRPENRKALKARQKAKKHEIVDEMLSKGCQKCGSSAELTFHHLEDKQFTIARGKNWSKVTVGRFKEEVIKCIVLCLSCHVTEHPELEGLSR
jgi:hypothetical protein